MMTACPSKQSLLCVLVSCQVAQPSSLDFTPLLLVTASEQQAYTRHACRLGSLGADGNTQQPSDWSYVYVPGEALREWCSMSFVGRVVGPLQDLAVISAVPQWTNCLYQLILMMLNDGHSVG